MSMLLSLIALLLVGPAAEAQVPVQRMTCAAAQKQVRQTGRYYKIANNTVVPIYPVYASSNACSLWEYTYTRRERTLDNPRCLVGYGCYPRDNDDF